MLTIMVVNDKLVSTPLALHIRASLSSRCLGTGAYNKHHNINMDECDTHLGTILYSKACFILWSVHSHFVYMWTRVASKPGSLGRIGSPAADRIVCRYTEPLF